MRKNEECVTWKGQSLLARFDSASGNPTYLAECIHAVRGLKILALPQPDREEGRAVSLLSVYAAHRVRSFTTMRRMLVGLHRPAFARDDSRERNIPVSTYELRYCASNKGQQRAIDIFLLTKCVVWIRESEASATACAIEASESDLRHLEDLIPVDICTERLPKSSLDPLLGPLVEGQHYGDVRRRHRNGTAVSNGDLKTYREVIESGAISSIPHPWPRSNQDFLMTCRSLMRSEGNVTLALRIQPTLLTQAERAALENEPPARDERTMCDALLSHPMLFWTHIQFASDSGENLRRLINTFSSEQAFGEWDSADQPASQKLARVQALTTADRVIAKHNLTRLEFTPWGAISKLVAEKNRPTAEGTDLPLAEVLDTEPNMWNPRQFLTRDVNMRPEYARLRTLFTLSEAENVWRFPIASPYGPEGIQMSEPSLTASGTDPQKTESP